MKVETIHARCREEIDQIVEEFSIDKIIYKVIPQGLSMGWDVHIFYDDIPEGSEQND